MTSWVEELERVAVRVVAPPFSSIVSSPVKLRETVGNHH